MTEPLRTALGPTIARILRGGTLLALLTSAVGFAWSLADPAGAPGPQPVVEGLRGGGPDALIAAGLLVLTLTPPVALAAAAIILARSAERRRAAVAAAVVVLLAVSLVVAALVGPVS